MVRVEIHDGVGVVALDRADRRNALTPEMFGVLFERVREVAAGSAQALVLAGEGSVFCGGFDLKLCLEQPGTIEKLLRLLAAFLGELQGISKPVVLAAHGAAIAGGCAMPRGLSVASRPCVIAGSPTEPRPREARVIPSCVAER